MDRFVFTLVFLSVFCLPFHCLEIKHTLPLNDTTSFIVASTAPGAEYGGYQAFLTNQNLYITEVTETSFRLKNTIPLNQTIPIDTAAFESISLSGKLSLFVLQGNLLLQVEIVHQQWIVQKEVKLSVPTTTKWSFIEAYDDGEYSSGSFFAASEDFLIAFNTDNLNKIQILNVSSFLSGPIDLQTLESMTLVEEHNLVFLVYSGSNSFGGLIRASYQLPGLSLAYEGVVYLEAAPANSFSSSQAMNLAFYWAQTFVKSQTGTVFDYSFDESTLKAINATFNASEVWGAATVMDGTLSKALLASGPAEAGFNFRLVNVSPLRFGSVLFVSGQEVPTKAVPVVGVDSGLAVFGARTLDGNSLILDLVYYANGEVLSEPSTGEAGREADSKDSEKLEEQDSSIYHSWTDGDPKDLSSYYSWTYGDPKTMSSYYSWTYGSQQWSSSDESSSKGDHAYRYDEYAPSYSSVSHKSSKDFSYSYTYEANGEDVYYKNGGSKNPSYSYIGRTYGDLERYSYSGLSYGMQDYGYKTPGELGYTYSGLSYGMQDYSYKTPGDLGYTYSGLSYGLQDETPGDLGYTYSGLSYGVQDYSYKKSSGDLGYTYSGLSYGLQDKTHGNLGYTYSGLSYGFQESTSRQRDSSAYYYTYYTYYTYYSGYGYSSSSSSSSYTDPYNYASYTWSYAGSSQPRTKT